MEIRTLLVASLLALHTALGSSTPPNVIIMLMDDMGYNDIGAYTYPSKSNAGPPLSPSAVESDNGQSNNPNFAKNLTPRIDSLARDGVRFTHFYSTSSVCSPSRAAFMTGSYPTRVGIKKVLSAGGNEGLNPSEVTLPELMRENGYLTAMAGKWHLGDKVDFYPTRHGFERYFGILYSNDMWPQNPHNSAWQDLKLMQNEKPLASYITQTGGIFSGNLDTNTEQSYLLEAMTENVITAIDDAVAESRPFFIYYSPHTPHVPIHPHPDYLSNSGQIDDEARYADLIQEIDARVGQILDTLDAPNNGGNTADSIADNTIVIFTSDNGPWQNRPNAGDLYQGAGSAYPFRGRKHSDWEGGHRVPFIVRYPNMIPAGVTLTQTASTFDIYATIAAFTGAKMPTDRTLDSVDISELLKGNTTEQPHDYFYYYDSNASKAAGIIDLTNQDAFKISLEDNKLYRLGHNFSGDFQESTDVSNTYPIIKSQLEAQMMAWNHAMDSRDGAKSNAVQIELETDKIVVAEGGYNTLRIRLSSAANKAVTISHFSGDNDLSVSSGSTLNFNATNWNQWQTVTFAAAGDSDELNSGATFRVSAPGLHIREIYAFESETGIYNSAPNISLTAPPFSRLHFPSESSRLLAEVSATDDGLPEGNKLIYRWSQLDGPGTATFDPPDTARTFISFNASGNYLLRAEVSDSIYTRSVDLSVYAGPAPTGIEDVIIFEYNFNESNGTSTHDNVGSTGNAMLTENGFSATQGPTWSTGYENGGLSFDGIDDFVMTPSVTISNDKSWTASAWIYLNAIPTSENRVILQQAGPTGRTWLFVNANGQLASFIGNQSTSGGAVTAGTWQKVAVSITSGSQASLRLFINDEQVAASTRTLENNTGVFHIGAHKNIENTQSLSWSGLLDTVELKERSSELQIDLPVVNSFDVWIQEQGHIPSHQQSPEDDPNKDGINNLLDYAFISSSNQPIYTYLPQVTATDYLQLNYRQRSNGSGTTGVDYAADGIIYSVELNQGLTHDQWQSGAAFVKAVGTPSPNGDGTESVTVRSIPSLREIGGRGFMRLQLEKY
ncbi:sulfatase-like hydrolase/transferase [Coraliomargarita sp. SDUM461003]|uniref:Sulfatase-like hydrolase/transferase n=1 Tax=Thalassobacterium maritimum TaxID=3041265 RepID=A0ABU1AXV9_9BACT|nr:sulfatase-like hydrolase/transferase [Coraliomargarita sp. SDUM461003]MDQ8208457.1 sulfatase-like hydrolase/transferase [Coraliomargarita sp. SDUM461003]